MDREQLAYMREHGLTWQDAYDYNMSWDFWRDACILNAGTDPGPNELAENTLGERITVLEEILAGFSQADLQSYTVKSLQDEVRQLKDTLRETYKRVAIYIPKPKLKHKSKPYRGIEP